MAITVNTNIDALKVQNLLNSATDKLSKTMQRMASGLKILKAGDDAAGTVIAAKIEVQLDGNKIAQDNIQNATNLLSTAEGNLDVIQENLTRIRDLTLSAKNTTYSADEKQAMQDEIDERIAEINRISSSSKYSGLFLFNRDDADKTGTDSLKDGAVFQVGADAREDNTIVLGKELFETVNFSALTGMTTALSTDGTSYKEGTTLEECGFNVAQLTLGGLSAAINNLDNAINNITHRKSVIGSAENRMDSALSTLVTQYQNLTNTKSVITDADAAQEASNFMQSQILQQISSAVLAQANQMPAIATSLI